MDVVRERLVELLAPARGERFLDVGTGDGELALRAARRHALVSGVDASERLLARARAAANEEGLAVHFDVGAADALPYGGGSFDVVASVFGVERREAVAEAARVCRRGGRLGLALRDVGADEVGIEVWFALGHVETLEGAILVLAHRV